jgi:hypothetical protein
VCLSRLLNRLYAYKMKSCTHRLVPGSCCICRGSACEVCETTLQARCVFESPQRLCTGCLAAVSFTHTFEREEEVVWGSLSPRGRRWLQDGQIAVLQSSSSVSYTEYLDKQADAADEEMINKDVYALSQQSSEPTASATPSRILPRTQLRHSVAAALHGPCQCLLVHLRSN